MPGKFVVIEGIDGAGTTTQCELLGKWLEEEGKEFLLTEEPFKRENQIGKIIKEHLVQGDEDHSPESIALAFAADRLVHLEDEISPAVEEGKIVVSDRYYHSSMVYQPEHGADLEWVREINKYARKPDLTIILDVPAKESIKRQRDRDGGESSVIFENLEFQKEIRERYIELEEILDENIYIVDGKRSIEEVHSDFREIIRGEIFEE
ncbi:MAG: dTMP kinase [Candidatus Aenigmatarchaeota archaeon]